MLEGSFILQIKGYQGKLLHSEVKGALTLLAQQVQGGPFHFQRRVNFLSSEELLQGALEQCAICLQLAFGIRLISPHRRGQKHDEIQ